jgi:hypothetical protein
MSGRKLGAECKLAPFPAELILVRVASRATGNCVGKHTLGDDACPECHSFIFSQALRMSSGLYGFWKKRLSGKRRPNSTGFPET